MVTLEIPHKEVVADLTNGFYLKLDTGRRKEMAEQQVFLLDVDGVLANFIQGIIDSHGWVMNHDQYDSWNYHRSIAISDEEFWECTYAENWWYYLNAYPWAQEIVGKLEAIGRVVFCTSPNHDASCPSQKVMWLRKHGFLGPQATNFQIGPEKELNARSGAILIDDSDANVKKYRDAGGQAFLFAQPWNAKSAVHTCNMADLNQFLESLENPVGLATASN